MTRDERSRRARADLPIPTMHSLLLAAKRDAANLSTNILLMQVRAGQAEKFAEVVKALRSIANNGQSDPQSRGIALAALNKVE